MARITNVIVTLRCPMSKKKYPYITINKQKMRLHRYIMQKHLGRDLLPSEHIYHLNGDETDNSIENLIIIRKNFKNES